MTLEKQNFDNTRNDLACYSYATWWDQAAEYRKCHYFTILLRPFNLLIDIKLFKKQQAAHFFSFLTIQKHYNWDAPVGIPLFGD